MGHCLVAYDIHSDALRREMGRRLESLGTRLQRSVFVVRLSASEKTLFREMLRFSSELS